MELTDFEIEYKGKKINNILMSSWVDMPNGFTNEDGEMDYLIMVKIAYIDENGEFVCKEGISKNFRFYPKAIDITNEN